MALDINGYNSVFNKFVQFAQDRFDSNEAKAVATATVTKSLQGRVILSIDASKTDEVHKWLRKNNEYAVNDRTRALFKAAIINMFGGESRIPASVKKAMLLGDYNAGKPLTARRILAVKAAIDADGTAAARAARIRLETFSSPEVKAAALGLGYMNSELPKLARAAHFYAEANNVSEMEAMREVGRPGSEANRLMNYGGRFLESAENFKDGLRLIGMFSQWHDGLSAVHDNISGNPPSYAGLDTPSKINMGVRVSQADAKFGLERFIFEDIATNPGFNLKETDQERAFGVEHNPASRFMVTADNVSTLGTIANMPPAKRRAVFAAFNAFNTLAASGPQRGDRGRIQLESIFLARVIRNLPKLEAILAKTGTLTGRDVIKNCFPDIRHPGNYDAAAIEAWENSLSDGMERFAGADYGAMTAMMESAGATLGEAEDAQDSGRTLPHVQYFTTAQYSIAEASSVAVAGLKTLSGDIDRISPYKRAEGDEMRPVFPRERQVWKFDFPDGQHFETGEKLHADIPNVVRKVRELCGEVHQKQIGSVAFLLSQAGTSALRDQPLAKYGIMTDEHSPVNFSLSRDAATGAVTIRYSSPVELPVKFSWTATVAVDGTISSTPMVIEAPVERLDSKAARALVEEAAANRGAVLTRAQTNEAVRLLQTHGTNMFAKNARIFARFLVKLVDSEKVSDAQRRNAIAAALAGSIREWRDFGYGDVRIAQFEAMVKAEASQIIRDYMEGRKSTQFRDDILSTMYDDSNRSKFTFNGTTYDSRPANELIPAFKALVPDAKKQRALSVYLNQLCLSTLVAPSMHIPYDSGAEAFRAEGFGMVVNLDQIGSNYPTALLCTFGQTINHDLQLSPDGRTATITQSITADLAAPDMGMYHPSSFGQVTLTQRLVIDLEPDIPTVIDYKLSQSIE